MKRLAVCCDGTWNRRDAEKPTNVVRMLSAIAGEDADGTEQVQLYVRGVGVESEAKSAIVRWLHKRLAGAFGWGLEANIKDGYRKLVERYEPGDAIYLFGFSRGAFTARSLAGLIRNCGILERRHIDRIDEAFDLYRSRSSDGHPDSELSRAFRLKYSRHVYLNAEELAWREKRAAAHPDQQSVDTTPPTLLRIAHIGVWDTVGALGIPTGLLFWRLSQRRHRFHDTNLSSTVESARHAVAVDEERRFYPPALWTNLERLNCSDGIRKAGTPFRQIWFPGDHSSIGGGGPHAGLEAIAFGWIAEGAAAANLALVPELVADRRAEANHMAPVLSRDRRPFPFFFRKARKGPSRIEEVAEPTIRRWRDDPDYDPKTLRHLSAALIQAGDELG